MIFKSNYVIKDVQLLKNPACFSISQTYLDFFLFQSCKKKSYLALHFLYAVSRKTFDNRKYK